MFHYKKLLLHYFK